MKQLILLACTLLFSINVLASSLAVSSQYVRATPPHVKNSAAFFTITNNTNKNIKLIAVKSDIAEQVQIHNNLNEDGMMKMRQVESIILKANSSTSLQPGGYHIMFLGLKNDLTEEDNVDITLYFDNGDQIKMTAPVQKISASHEKSDKIHH